MDRIQDSAKPAVHSRNPVLAEKSALNGRVQTEGSSAFMQREPDARRAQTSRMDFEDLLTRLTDSLSCTSGDDLNQALQSSLGQIGDWFDADRTSLLESDESTGAMSVKHRFLRSGFKCTSELSVTSASLERLRKGQMVLLTGPDIRILGNRDEAARLALTDIKWGVLVPLRVNDHLCGALSLASRREHDAWDTRAMTRLRSIANILASTVARRRAEERLHSMQSQLSDVDERYQLEHHYRREEIELCHTHNAVVGQSDAIRGVLRKVEQVAPMDSAVLILGETGTGKELIARTIHELSRRHDRQMIRVNCAAMPATLIESELFGREKGAYTGALSREIGRFELADRSTIFLDEIGEMPLEVQSKLLRVLQDGEFERLGSSRTIHVNARVIAATNRDLQAAVREGKFREDLYYRLNVFPIEIPPLRERRSDIPALVWHSIKRLCKQMGIEIDSIHPQTMRALEDYSWPGNVRELGNLIERYLILNRGPVFRAEVPRSNRPTLLVGERLEDVERHHILTVLRRTNWRIRGKEGSAEILGVKATTLEARMKRLGITRPPEFVKRRDESFDMDNQRNIA